MPSMNCDKKMLNLLLIISNSLVDKISKHMDGEIAQEVRSRDNFMLCKHENLSSNPRNQKFWENSNMMSHACICSSWRDKHLNIYITYM